MLSAWRCKDVANIGVTMRGLGRQTCSNCGYVSNRPRTLNVTLMPVGKLRGRVVPVGFCSASVTIDVATGCRQEGHLLLMCRRIATDVAGRFEITQMARGMLVISVRDRLSEPYQYCAKEQIDWRDGRTEELILRLQKAVHIHGVCRYVGAEADISEFRLGCQNSLDTGESEHQNGGVVERDNFITRFVNIDAKGNFDFYAFPGLMEVFLDEHKKVELDHFANWEFSYPGGANLGHDGMMFVYREHGVFWERLDTRRAPPLRFAFVVPSGIDYFECPTMQFCEIEGRVIDSKGTPVAKVEISGFGDRTTESDQEGKFHLRFDATHTYSLDFNPDQQDTVQGADGVYKVVSGPGKLPKYESKTIKWSIRRFGTGKIPDVALPLRRSEK